VSKEKNVKRFYLSFFLSFVYFLDVFKIYDGRVEKYHSVVRSTSTIDVSICIQHCRHRHAVYIDIAIAIAMSMYTAVDVDNAVYIDMLYYSMVDL
jgi:uncharacterized membrane protein